MKLEFSFISFNDVIKKTVNKACFTVGRGQAADIVFTHRELSRVHFQIKLEGKQFYVTDLASSNGTFLNGKKIAPNTAVAFGDSDRVGFGDYKDIYFAVKVLEVETQVSLVDEDIPPPVRLEDEVSKKVEIKRAASKEFNVPKQKSTAKAAVDTRFDISAPNPRKAVYEKERRTLQKKIVALKLIVEQLQEHSSSAKEELDKLGSEKLKLMGEVDSLKESFQDTLRTKQTLQEDISALLEEKKSAAKQMQESSAQAESVRKIVEGLNAEIEGLKSEKINLQNEIKELALKKQTSPPVEPATSTKTDDVTQVRVVEDELSVTNDFKIPSSPDIYSDIPLPKTEFSDIGSDVKYLEKRYYKTLSDLAIIEEAIEEKQRVLSLLEEETGLPSLMSKVS